MNTLKIIEALIVGLQAVEKHLKAQDHPLMNPSVLSTPPIPSDNMPNSSPTVQENNCVPNEPIEPVPPIPSDNIPNPPPAIREDYIPNEPVEPKKSPDQTVGVELDSTGYPWDERIHSRKKTKIKGGIWRIKRLVPDELIESVRAEWDQKQRENTQPSTDTPISIEESLHTSSKSSWTFSEFMSAIHKGSISSEKIHEACRQHGVSEGFTGLAKNPEKIYLVADGLGLKK
jgi:hypothetical protein